MRPYMVRWQKIADSDDVVFTVAYEPDWWEWLTGVTIKPRRYRGSNYVWSAYPSGRRVSSELNSWLSGLKQNIDGMFERRNARLAREAEEAKMKRKSRLVTEITDAEIVAAANVMLEPQSSVHEINGVRTYKTYDELDEIAQQELGYQVAVAIAAAEAARYGESFPIPGSSSETSPS